MRSWTALETSAKVARLLSLFGSFRPPRLFFLFAVVLLPYPSAFSLLHHLQLAPTPASNSRLARLSSLSHSPPASSSSLNSLRSPLPTACHPAPFSFPHYWHSSSLSYTSPSSQQQQNHPVRLPTLEPRLSLAAVALTPVPHSRTSRSSQASTVEVTVPRSRKCEWLQLEVRRRRRRRGGSGGLRRTRARCEAVHDRSGATRTRSQAPTVVRSHLGDSIIHRLFLFQLDQDWIGGRSSDGDSGRQRRCHIFLWRRIHRTPHSGTRGNSFSRRRSTSSRTWHVRDKHIHRRRLRSSKFKLNFATLARDILAGRRGSSQRTSSNSLDER